MYFAAVMVRAWRCCRHPRSRAVPNAYHAHVWLTHKPSSLRPLALPSLPPSIARVVSAARWNTYNARDASLAFVAVIEHLGASIHGPEWSKGRVVATCERTVNADGKEKKKVRKLEGDRSTFAVGDFPDTYVDRLKTPCVVKGDFDYPAKDASGKRGKREKGHLRIKKGDDIVVMEGPELGSSRTWWMGFNRRTKKFGEFPSTYTTAIEYSWDIEPEAVVLEGASATISMLGDNDASGTGDTDISMSAAKRRHRYNADGTEVGACDGVQMCAHPPECVLA